MRNASCESIKILREYHYFDPGRWKSAVFMIFNENDRIHENLLKSQISALFTEIALFGGNMVPRRIPRKA